MGLFSGFRRPRGDPANRPAPWWSRVRGVSPRDLTWPRLLLVLCAFAVVATHLLLFPPTRSIKSLDLEAGTITDQEVRAPFGFTAPRPARELDAARAEAAQRVEPVYRLLPGAAQRTELATREFFRQLTHFSTLDSIPESTRIQRFQAVYPGLGAERVRTLLDPEFLPDIQAAVEAVVRRQLSAGIVDLTPRGTYQNARILDPDGQVETSRPVGSLVLGYRLEEAVRSDLQPRISGHAPVEAAVAAALEVLQPNLAYDDTETERRRVAAAELVPTRREFVRNERILEAGVRVSRDHIGILEALEAARVERALAQDSTIGVRLRGGRILLMVLLIVGFGLVLRQADRRVLREPNRMLLLTLLLLMFLGLAQLAVRNPSWGGPAAVPIVALAMLATILFGESVGARASMFGLLSLAVVASLATPVWVVWGAVAAATVRMVRRVRHRNQFYRAVGVVGVVYGLGLLGVGLAEGASAAEIGRGILRGVLSGVASTALCLFLLPLFEAAFGITTELTLLELSDLNHPLLKRMSLESPGTYHHSQVVGTLAEGAAHAVGANSLLARVGANFHDIGKMLKPRYYVENQSGNNAHDELSPSMSALVIAAHVKDGIELGRQWGLPREVIAYIPEHHGTSVMQYFYKKALEGDESGTVKVDDFRYPGPKPQTRETAIVMLADGVEASTRSLRRPTASRIREMVRKIIDRRLADGELDECGLSLSDLARVRESFIPTLVGIHHQRVAYPGQREHEDQKEKESREARSRGRRGTPSVASNA